jgi:hypothetical protein
MSVPSGARDGRTLFRNTTPRRHRQHRDSPGGEAAAGLSSFALRAATKQNQGAK